MTSSKIFPSDANSDPDVALPSIRRPLGLAATRVAGVATKVSPPP